jgi:hypothetical protein
LPSAVQDQDQGDAGASGSGTKRVADGPPDDQPAATRTRTVKEMIMAAVEEHRRDNIPWSGTYTQLQHKVKAPRNLFERNEVEDLVSENYITVVKNNKQVRVITFVLNSN